jgi:hypothetical protein
MHSSMGGNNKNSPAATCCMRPGCLQLTSAGKTSADSTDFSNKQQTPVRHLLAATPETTWYPVLATI